jgi:hypothetical protein
MSENPDIHKGDMLFLRGNIAWKELYENTLTISEHTPIFFPVSTCCFYVGEPDTIYGLETKDELQTRHASRLHSLGTDEIWATMDDKPLVEDLCEYLVESPMFNLIVPSQSALGSLMATVLEPASYRCVSVGYNILIVSIQEGIHSLRFGGKGPGGYHTDSLYHITVAKKKPNKTIDKSRKNIPVFVP